MTRYFETGKIVNTHGLKGEIKLIPDTDFPDQRFVIGHKLYIAYQNQHVPVTIKSVRTHKGFYYLSFENYDDIDQVVPFKGCLLCVAEEDLQALNSGEYYYHDIIGLKVQDQQHQEIGQVKEILSYGPNDVWVIARPQQRDLLLPYLKSVMLEVNLETKLVTVEVPEGLDE